MYDENPQIGSDKVDLSLIDESIYPMELLNDEDGSYYGCAVCLTDAFLTDEVL